MHRFSRIALLAVSLFSTGAALAATRTYVASYGNDGNTASNCSPTTPCRTLFTAMSVTDDGGEIIVLDSAGYGRLTITKSLSIIAPAGVYAGLVAGSGQNVIDINTAGINVVLKGLTINGQGLASDGVSMQNGASLTVENCEIANVTNFGIGVGGGVDARILDTVIRKSLAGIYVTGGASASISGVRIFRSGIAGVYVEGSGSSTSARISDSVIKGTGVWYGIHVSAPTASTQAKTIVARTTISDVDQGIIAVTGATGAVAQVGVTGVAVTGASIAGLMTTGSFGSPTITVGQSLITGNAVGLYNQYGVLKSFGSNIVSDNGSNTTGVISTTSQM